MEERYWLADDFGFRMDCLLQLPAGNTCQESKSLSMLKRPGTGKSADNCATQETNKDTVQSASESAGLSVLSPVVLVCSGTGMMSPCLS